MSKNAAPLPTAAELDRLYHDVRNWERFTNDGEGALALIAPSNVSAAARLVRHGIVVSLGRELSTEVAPECPSPAEHRMLADGATRDSTGIPGYEATRDFVGSDVHGLGVTHIDALCHMFVRGEMFGGLGPEFVTDAGASRNSIGAAGAGIVGEGILLDIPALLGVDYLAADSLVTGEHLLAAERRQGVEVREGSLLLISTGRDRRRRESATAIDPITDGLAGLHPDCLKFFHDRGIALLGSDGISDRMPATGIDQWPFPIHQIAITAIGLHLIDNMQLDSLAEQCEATGQWEFLLTVAPLRIPMATGCLVNPIATL